MPFAIGLFVIVLVLYYFASRGDKDASREGENGEDDLLHLCLGNRKQVERLISLEQQKSPGIDRAEAVSRAIASMRRDTR